MHTRYSRGRGEVGKADLSAQKIPKKQHYLPRFYLAGFGQNGKVWVHKKESGVYELRNPKTLATKHHYYTVLDEEGKKDATVENVLGMVESTAARIIAKLETPEMISVQDKIHLAQFVALMKFRVPVFERWFADFSEATIKQKMKDDFPTVESIRERMKEMDGYDPAEPDRAEGIFAGLQDPKYRVVPNDSARIAAMLTATLEISRLMAFMEWTFLVAPEEASFVTTDDPVLVLGPSGPPPDPPEGWPGEINPYSLAGEGFGAPGTQTAVPLSKRVYLVAEGEGAAMKLVRADTDWVSFANETHAARRDDLLIAGDEALLRRLVGG